MPTMPSSFSAPTNSTQWGSSTSKSFNPSPSPSFPSSASSGSLAGNLGLGTARNLSVGPPFLGSPTSSTTSSGLNATAAVYHPYKRQTSARSLKDKEREKKEKGRGTPSPVPPPPGVPTGQASQAGSYALSALGSSSSVSAQPQQPPDLPRIPSHDANPNTTQRPIISSLPPGAAPPIFPGTSYTRTGSSTSSTAGMSMTRSPSGSLRRQRANSTGSTSSIGSHGTIGVAMRAGRVGVPMVLGSGYASTGSGTEGSSAPSDRVFKEEEEDAFRRSGHTHTRTPAPIQIVSNRSEAFEDAPSPARPSHRRQSSSTSSVGQVIRPTIGGATIGVVGANPALTSTSSPSMVSPVTVVGEVRAPPAMPSNLGSGNKTLPPSPVSPGWKNEKVAEKEKEKEKKSGGLKGRLQKALKKDSEKEKEKAVSASASSKTPPKATAIATTSGSRVPAPALPMSSPARSNGMAPSISAPAMIQRTPQTNYQSNDSESSTQSSAQPKTPPEVGPASYPNLGARRPSNSSFAPSMVEPLNGGLGKPKRSLFNMKNASTDNISISSTVSSASMMIRRMGALGKLARRNSLAGISKIFKDKSKEDDDLEPPKEGKKSKKDKKGLFGAKSDPATSSTSYATADADRSFEEDRTLNGLSPAAQLARQHTLRSKAEENRSSIVGDDSGSISTMGTATPGQFGVVPPDVFGGADDRSEDDSDLDDAGQNARIEDVAARLAAVGFQDPGYRGAGETGDGGEYGWGQTYRDRHAVPERGILKASQSYNGQDARVRLARSSSVEFANQEPGPLAKVPSASFDNIDGISPVERENDPTLAGGSLYDPFSSSFSPFDHPTDREPLADRLNMPYSNASLNTSAPVLSKIAPGKGIRSATSPLQRRKNLNWAPECAVYHTFHSSEYDRRSGPATCNSLTPEIAQQIKDELNGYKMEEMDVHPSSRVHTHFL